MTNDLSATLCLTPRDEIHYLGDHQEISSPCSFDGTRLSIALPTSSVIALSGDATHDGDRLVATSGVLDILDRDGTELAVAVSDGTVKVYAVSRRAAPIEIPEADAAALFGDDSIEPWLRDEVARLLATEVDVDRLAAVGTIGRLWTAHEDRQATLARLLAGDRSPSDRAIVWAQALPVASLDRLVNLLAVNAEELGRSFADRDRTSIALERDDLESIAFVLRCHASAADRVTNILAVLDRRAASALVEPAPRAPSPRLDAVAWQEPLAWWAAESPPDREPADDVVAVARRRVAPGDIWQVDLLAKLDRGASAALAIAEFRDRVPADTMYNASRRIRGTVDGAEAKAIVELSGPVSTDEPFPIEIPKLSLEGRTITLRFLGEPIATGSFDRLGVAWLTFDARVAGSTIPLHESTTFAAFDFEVRA